MNVPAISEFVPDKPSESVTSFKPCLRNRIMSGTNCIVTCFFPDSDFPETGSLIVDSPEQAVIVMDAGSVENHSFSIQEQAFFNAQ